MKLRLLKILTVIAFFAAPTLVSAQSAEADANKEFAAGRYSQAAELYDEAAEMANSMNQMDKEKQLKQKASKSRQAASLLSAGNKAWNSKDYTTAREKYAKLLNINSKDKTAKSRIEQIDAMPKESDTPTGQKQNNNSDSGAKQPTTSKTLSPQESYALTKAMDFYKQRNYSDAVINFRNAGDQSLWTREQRDAFDESLRVEQQKRNEDIAYNRWVESEPGMKVSIGELFIDQYPASTHANEVRDSLFNYYISLWNYDKADTYAHTQSQRQQVESLRKSKSTRANAGKQAKRTSSSSPSYSKPRNSNFKPFFSIAAELDIMTQHNELAIPLQYELLKKSSKFNIALGVRPAIRGTFVTERYALNPSSYNSDTAYGGFSYMRISPFVKLHYNLGDMEDGCLYVAAGAAFNYNFNAKYSHIVSGGTSKTKSDISGYLNSTTFTIRGEIGYRMENVGIHLYFDKDLASPFSDEGVTAFTNSHYDMALNTKITDRMKIDFVIGAGLRISF